MPTIRELLAVLAHDKTGEQIAKHSYGGLSKDQVAVLAKRDIPTYTGKVREVFRRGDELLIVHSDRLTAFDKLIANVPQRQTVQGRGHRARPHGGQHDAGL